MPIDCTYKFSYNLYNNAQNKDDKDWNICKYVITENDFN